MNKVRTYISISLFFFISTLVFAQSDYRITQEFKSRQRSFEIAIEYAKSLEELNKIKKEINEFRNEFKGNKELLNRALYPGNFESSFELLENKIEYSSKKISEISGLQDKVSILQTDYEKISKELRDLTNEVNILRSSNSQLMSELRAFKSGYGGSKEEIDSLRNIVEDLRIGISKRDTLIKDIMDNIFMSAEHKLESLDDAEKRSFRAKIQGTSLIDNIRNLISDNIDFLEASLFTADDLSSLDEEFYDFEERWSVFGPQLFDIYSQDKTNRAKLEEIDSLIVDWERSINLSTWKSIDATFRENGIELLEFNDDSTFTNSVVEYIENEIDNLKENLSVQSEQKYVYFVERTWNDILRPKWIPLLLSQEIITENQLTEIELKLEEWKDNLKGSKSYFIYGIIILLAIIIIISIFLIIRKNKNQSLSSIHIEEEKESKGEDPTSGISENDKFIDDKKEE